jgi:chemotaxis protein methyltransferase WspC
MSFEDFEQLLKQAIGLDAASIGLTAIERAVKQRMAACRAESLRAYGDMVRGSESERQELIEAVVVPETWFFRDREAFTTLGRIMQKDRLDDESMVRILSMPSSTGEEAYSIAMALFDAGMMANRFSIDAIDVSQRALARADRAVYGKNSFRGNDLGFRDRYFEATEQGYHVNERVSRQVRFQRGNLFESDMSAASGSYDIVFCRNLLIYFDRATQDRAVRIVERLLKPHGVLFVAPAETGLLLGHDFDSMKIPLAFAFTKGAAKVARRRGAPASPTKAVADPSRFPGKTAPAVKPIPAFSVPESAPQAPSVNPPTRQRENVMEQATHFADQGRFVEAVRCCEESLRSNGPSAQAFYLMGLVRDATGSHLEATESYRKALYLDPDHYEALIHLAFLMEKQGSTAAALTLRERARRVEEKRKV